MSIRERPSTLIGMWLIVVFIGLKLASGTLLSKPGPSPIGGFFGGGTGGGGTIGTDGFHSGGGVAGPGGGGSIVFPGPNDRRSTFFGLLKLPYIICHYAATGAWPPFPPQLHAAVLDLGRHVFAMDDYGIRNYCGKHFRVTVAHRPCCAVPVIHPVSNHPGFSHDEFPDKPKPTRKRPAKKPSKPSSDEIDTEVITDIDEEGGGEEPPPEYAEEEEPAEGDYGRLQLPTVDGRRKPRPKNMGRCTRGAKGCRPSNTVPFIPLRNGKTSSEAADMNRKRPEEIQFTTTAKSVVPVDGKIGRNIPK